MFERKTMKSEVTGIILAGGQSKRMGTFKAFVRLKGKPLIDYALDALQEITPNVILSTGVKLFHYKNLPVVEDVYPGCGPVAGIYSALRFSETDLNLVLSCDMPFVTAHVLNFIVEKATEHDGEVTLPVDNEGYLQTLCAVYRKSTIPYFEQAFSRRELKLRTVIEKTNFKALQLKTDFKNYHPDIFLNVNTPEMIKQAEKIIHNRKQKSSSSAY
jgi:molybdopterin-guanine dinucleotide biosynthesis protein A